LKENELGLQRPDLNQRSAKTYAPVKAKEKQKVPEARLVHNSRLIIPAISFEFEVAA
jgi:hypothetical protein